MDNLLGPFGDEAVAGLIGVLMTTLVVIIRDIIRRKKPHYLVCEETHRTSLEVMKEAREGTEVHYGGRKVSRLSVMKLRLHNRGSDVLKDASFIVRFNPEVKIVGTPTFTVVPEQDQKLILPSEEDELSESENEKRFRISHINDFRLYKQVAIIDFICDGEITDVAVLGSGPGWAVKSWSINDKAKIRDIFKKTEQGLILSAFLLFMLGAFVSSEAIAGIGIVCIVLYMFLDTVGKFFIKRSFKWRYGISVEL